MKTVYIASYSRTPVGGFGGSLASMSAPQLGAAVIKEALNRSGYDPAKVKELYMGNVLSANIGQSPARQAGIYAGLPYSADATTINKVCSSGLKAITSGALSVMAGKSEAVIAGGMESMSNVPYYSQSARSGNKLGHVSMTDGIIKDGLWDVYNDFHMGSAAELCVKKFSISREEQDEYAARSYSLAIASNDQGLFNNELVPVKITDAKGNEQVITKDEDPYKVKYEKMPMLKPAFEKDGTITAANASNINDGAAAVLMLNEDEIKRSNIMPQARIVDFIDVAQKPEWFTIAPSMAINELMTRNGMTVGDISLFEINEAYACVPLVNRRLLGIPMEKINVLGGAVAIGHPIGASGARIVCTLITALKQKGGRYGIAAICNGGGGSTAMLVEMM